MKIYFSDFFNVSPKDLEDYGAFDISLVNDLPLFIDPFLLFRSEKPEYQALHADIIQYVAYLRDQSLTYQGEMEKARLEHLYYFKEVKQNWLGFSVAGNKGRALAGDFARGLDKALYTLFPDFGGAPVISKGSHLEKVCLVSEGVGRDGLSDFTTNLIKDYLLEYTQIFARKYLSASQRKKVTVPRVKFDYEYGQWVSTTYELPWFRDDYVILTPKDILTKDDVWINRSELYDDYADIAFAIPDDQLRYQINDYFKAVLPPGKASNIERGKAIKEVINRFPQILDYYIKDKEENGDEAVARSASKVVDTETLFVQQVRDFVDNQLSATEFYQHNGDTIEGARARALILKQAIEKEDGYKVFYLGKEPIQTEDELKILYRLVWHATLPDQEPAEAKEPDKDPVQFKLARNSRLDNTFQQLAAALKANDHRNIKLTVVVYTSPAELEVILKLQNEYGLAGSDYIIPINAHTREAASSGVQITPRNRKQESIRRRAAILTALPDEYDAVRAHLKNPNEDPHEEGNIYEYGTFEAPGGNWEVWIAEIGAGNANAAMEAERLFRHCRPSVALFVGVAGGVKSVELGDVVVADKVVDYQVGKDDEEFLRRTSAGETSFRLVTRARTEKRKSDWLERLNQDDKQVNPAVRIGPIAAGEKVVSSTRSATAQFLRQHYNDTLAVEMEGRGFLIAAHANESIKALVIRGISDLLDEKTEKADKEWQPRAARIASAFAFEILAKLSQPEEK